MAGSLIGALRVSLSAETSAFEQGMKRSQQAAAKTAGSIKTSFGGVTGYIKSSLAGIATALTIGTLVRAGKDALEYAAHLGELADTLGLTTKDLQTFSYAAGQVGISQDELEAGIQKLTISMGKAQLGSQAQVKAFNAIGISIDQLKGKDAGEVFRLIAQKLENVSDRSQRAAIEVALFGKAGAKLDNLLSGSQGRLDELSAAAERLGIVLSDEQIAKADETADRLAALQTVLKANIAGVVADNADSILELANALAEVVRFAAGAARLIGKVADAINSLPSPPGWFTQFANTVVPGSGVLITAAQAASASSGNARSITLKLPPATKRATPVTVDDFLAPSGGKKHKGAADHSAQDALRAQHDFDQDLRRANTDVLRAQQDLAGNYIERTSIGIEILNAEKDAREAEFAYQAALFKLTKGKEGQSEEQIKQLRAAADITDGLERQKLLQDEETQRAEDVQELTQHDFDRRRDILEAQADLAETASERRKVELDILELAYAQKRQALQNIIDTSKDIKAQEDARRDLENLKTTHALDQAGVIASTRGPMEDFLASLPTTAAKADEALQRLEVQGFQGLIDAAGQLTEGFDSAIDALLSTLQNFISGLLQLQLQKGLGSFLQGGGGAGALGFLGSLFGGSGGFSSAGFASVVSGNAAALGSGGIPLGASGGGLLPFASGGSLRFGGRPGIDKNILSMNGLPFARVSYGERMNITNDNGRSGGMSAPPFVFNNYAKMSAAEARATGAQAAAGWTAEMNRARTKGIG